jgi:hypothetical protein
MQGTEPSLATTKARCAAIEQAFDYRGDVTIQTNDGRTITGYVFDRRSDVGEPYIRMIQADSGDRVTVQCARVVRLSFTGRDTAVGKSWETWVKNYKEKKKRGERASIEAEPLD